MDNSIFYEDYTRLDELGQGGYATVYKVRHNQLDYVRAIRVLNRPISLGENDPIYKKFLDECRLLLRLGNGCHPNIVRIFRPLLRSQQALVEMDYISGCDLNDYIKIEKFVDTEEVINLATDISSALAYCHIDIYKYCMDREADNLEDDPNDGNRVLLNQGIIDRLINKYRVIHNDIHSGNIMRNIEGRYILLDFGLSIQGDTVIRQSRRENGAPEFKSPEKWDGEDPIPQTDIYSFGIVLYEMLTGRVPFIYNKKLAVEAELTLYKEHKKKNPPPIFELRKIAFEKAYPGKKYKKDYPEWLEYLILKCLSKNPKDRFSNGKELSEFIKSKIIRFTEEQSIERKTEIEKLEQKCIELETKLKALNRNMAEGSFVKSQRIEINAKEPVDKSIVQTGKHIRKITSVNIRTSKKKYISK